HTTTEPNAVSREVSAEEVEAMYRHYVQPHLDGVSARCVKAATCLYTVTPDHHFLMDTHPDFPQILVASPCSGHGFKHSAAIGEVLAQWVTEGRSQIDVRAFSFGRF